MCDYSDLNPKFQICVFDFGTTQLSYSHHWQGLQTETRSFNPLPLYVSQAPVSSTHVEPACPPAQPPWAAGNCLGFCPLFPFNEE